MFKNLLYFSLIIFLVSCSSKSDKEKANEDILQQENSEQIQSFSADGEEISIEKEEIHFTEVWIWEYLSPENETKELWIYREPAKDYWLFEKNSSFGVSSEMCEWVLAKPNGDYVMSFKSGKKVMPNSFYDQKIEFGENENFTDFWEITNGSKSFADSEISQKSFEGKKYKVNYKGQPEASEFYVGSANIDFRPIYYFNHLEGDIELPISFPWDIPKNQLVLQEKTDFPNDNIKIRYQLKEVSPNSYYIYLPKK